MLFLMPRMWSWLRSITLYKNCRGMRKPDCFRDRFVSHADTLALA